MEIVSPSDFKIKISAIKDSEGNLVSPQDVYINIILTARYGNPYVCTWTKDITTSKNVEYDEDNDTLYLIVEDYNLKGQVYMRLGTATDDSAFKDGKWNWWQKEMPLDIKIV